jgi:hypothetical protein
LKTNPSGKCIKLEELQLETFALSNKVFPLFGGLSKSVSPDEDRERILATYTVNRAKLVRAKYARIFDKIKNGNRNIRVDSVDTYILIMHCIVLNKNK